MKITNRLISLLLCIVMISAIACLSVSAKTVYTVGDWVYEKINDDTEFEIDEYKGSAASLRTVFTHNGLSITSVGEHAFLDNTTLTSIILSDPVHSIQSGAFFGATSLKSVDIRGVITYIGANAFTNCTSLETIDLESTQITAVEYSAFSNCDALKDVTLPDTVEKIGDTAFAQCDNLSKITIPESVTTISSSAFDGSDNVVIYCYENSTAHIFADNNGIEYVLLTPAETYMLGDSDDDGHVSVLDAALIQYILAECITDEDGRISIRANVDRDKALSIMDASYIQMYLASMTVDVEIGKTFEY